MPRHQPKNRWSADVTAHSDALDLEPKVFEKRSAGQIAKSLKRSAESSDRRKTSAFRSTEVEDYSHGVAPPPAEQRGRAANPGTTRGRTKK